MAEERLVEVVGHRSGKVSGYIPITVLTEMGIEFEEGRTTWFTAEQSAAIKAHPQFEVRLIDGRDDASDA
jgi:hypothetical protein